MPVSVSNASHPKRIKRLENSRYRDLLWLLLSAAIVIVADQISKFWAVEKLSDGPSISVIGDFFMLTLVYNRGGALGTNFGPSLYYLISSLIILIIVVYYAYINRSDRPVALPLALITGGAIGNVIDRIRIGKVVDFLDFDFFDIYLFGYQLERWWTFNIADSAISCSIVFLLIYMMLNSKRESATASPSDQGAESLEEQQGWESVNRRTFTPSPFPFQFQTSMRILAARKRLVWNSRTR